MELESGAEPSQLKKIEVESIDHEQIKQKLEDILLSSDVSERMEDVRELVKLYISSDNYKGHEIDLNLTALQQYFSQSQEFNSALWLVNIPEEFFDFPNLMREMLKIEGTISPEQINEMKMLREKACIYLKSVQDLSSRIGNLKTKISSHISRRQRHIEDIMKLLTPLQVAKFCLWVNSNPLCMQMLNTVWRC
jgi:hypothetical protein